MVHSGENLGYTSTANDDVGVFRSTINSVLKTQFPSVNSEMIEIIEISLTIENSAIKTLVKNCSIASSNSNLWPIIASQDQHWRDTISVLRRKIETKYKMFIRKNPRFTGQVYLIGDVIGGIACFDYLTGHEVISEKDIDRRKASTVSSPACERSWTSSNCSINRRSPSAQSQRLQNAQITK